MLMARAEARACSPELRVQAREAVVTKHEAVAATVLVLIPLSGRRRERPLLELTPLPRH
jgi:hypothetical protein